MASFQDLIDAFNQRREPAKGKRSLAGADYFMLKSSKEDLAKRQATLEESGLPGVLKQAGQEMYENPVVNTAIGFTPGVGDLQSAFEAIKSAREGNYGEAGLNALGVLPFVPALGGVISPTLSKFQNAREAAANIKSVLETTGGKLPYQEIAQMNPTEFSEFYDFIAPHHQGKFDRLLRSYNPSYEDLPTTMKQYAQDFGYENPGLVSKFKNVKPDDKVTIYRSVTKSDPDATINPGDWIALESKYASQHGHLGADKPRMMKMEVPAKDIRWAGTSADEYFYVPSENIRPEIGSKYQALQQYVQDLNK